MSCRRTHEIRSHRSKNRWVNKNKSICNEERRKKYNFNKLLREQGLKKEVSYSNETLV